MRAAGFGSVLAALSAVPALAHTGAGATGAFAAGVAHPLLGLDHVLAMATVGLWAGLAGGRARWAWPAAFLAAMALGAGLGAQSLAVGGAELAVAASVLLLGLAVAARLRPGVALGAALCGAFALSHGYVHGVELPPAVPLAGYLLGFVLATALLHALGAAAALALARPGAARWARLAGGAVAAAGAVLLAG